MTPKELKKHLVVQGFQVFRTLGERVVLAQRVRDNLIMDSGVSVGCEPPHTVRVTTRAHARDYPEESEQELFARARAIGQSALGDDYAESGTEVVKMDDPSDAQKVLDTSYQVSFEKPGIDTSGLAEELRAVLELKKLA